MKSNSTHLNLKSLFAGLFMLISFFFMTATVDAQVAINNDNSNPDASAMLDVKATGLGFLAPRMTLAQRPAAPATGLLIYQTDSNPGYYYYNGSAWVKVISGSLDDNDWAWFSGSGLTGELYRSGDVALGSVSDPDDNGLYVQNYTFGKAAVRGTDQSGAEIYADGMLGVLSPSSLGIPVSVVNIGVLGIKPNAGANGAAVYGWNNDGNSMNYGGIFAADGAGTTNYGIYADADNGTSSNYAGYFKGRVEVQGNSADDNAADSAQTVLYARVNLNGSFNDTKAVHGYSHSRDGYGIGIYGEGGYRGVEGRTVYDAYTGTSYGVYGYASGTAGTRIGVYGYAFGGTTANWAGYFQGTAYATEMRVGGTTGATGYALSVNGKIACEEVLIDDNSFWPDYVFAEDYNLLSIDEFEQSIKENNHLPGMPSANQIEEEGGYHLGEIQKKTLEKVEELSLYIIELNNRVKTLEAENQQLKTEIENQ
ncbi:MAG: hypothetical protein KQI35_08460 [Bacteroidetes bacterium]|nr:hypothetical protein [Bacteroidota bacterium]